MMCFVYIFRDKSGAKREATIDADSREAAFAALKSRGISPLSVRDGGSAQRVPLAGGGRAASRCTAAPQASGIRSGRAVSFVFLAAFVLLAACSLWWWLDGSDAHRPVPVPVERSSSPRSVKEVSPSISSRVIDASSRPRTARGTTPQKAKVRRAIVSVVTNDNFVLTTIEENGSRRIVTESLVPPTFKNPMHQLIAAAIAMDGDGEMAPLPLGPGDDAAMRSALKIPIEDMPTDTEEIKKLKDAVRATRKDIETLMDQGVSVSDIFTHHRELWNENVKIRNEMKSEYMRYLRAGDAEAAVQYLEKINHSFREMGIPEIGEADIQPKGKRKRRTAE